MFVLLLFISLSACKEEIIKPIELEQKEFNVYENSPNGTLVGTYEHSDKESGKKYIYEIISGNKENLFSINSQGEILVNNSNSLDYEKISSLNLLIKATLDNNLNVYYLANVLINIINILPTNNNLVAFYDLNGNANDFFDTYNASLSNILFLESENNLKNKVAYFNGLNSYINLPNAFDYSNRTISVWFNAIDLDSDLKIIYTSDNPSLGFGLIVMSVTQTSGVPILNLNFSNQIHSHAIDKGKWYNAVIKTNGLTYSYYVNGALVKNQTAPSYTASSNGNQTALLGCLRNLSSRFFIGKIDNVRIYNRDLSNEEIAIIYREEVWTD